MVATNKGWIGVDFDGTLADYSRGWVAPDHCGAPVPDMLERVKFWLGEGYDVRIFTARIWPLFDAPVGIPVQSLHTLPGISPTEKIVESRAAVDAIRAWCREHLGRELRITNVKDLAMVELYDDRCVQVLADTGVLVGKSSRGIPA